MRRYQDDLPQTEPSQLASVIAQGCERGDPESIEASRKLLRAVADTDNLQALAIAVEALEGVAQ
jgi:hypothetical protein